MKHVLKTGRGVSAACARGKRQVETGRGGTEAHQGRGRADKCTLTLPRTSPDKRSPDVSVSVRPPRAGLNTAPVVRGLGVEWVVVLKVRIRVATRARCAGSGRLQANEVAAPVQDEVAPGENGRMIPLVTGP